VIWRKDIRVDRGFLAGQDIPSRRHHPRVETPHGVWVYWNCKGREDTSRVQNLSTAGLFVETAEVRAADTTVRLDFLVQEGQIRAKAVVRHVRPGNGLGLKFTALAVEDGPRLTALMTRLHSVSQVSYQPGMKAPSITQHQHREEADGRRGDTGCGVRGRCDHRAGFWAAAAASRIKCG
jgi:hypothetical protein